MSDASPPRLERADSMAPPTTAELDRLFNEYFGRILLMYFRLPRRAAVVYDRQGRHSAAHNTITVATMDNAPPRLERADSRESELGDQNRPAMTIVGMSWYSAFVTLPDGTIIGFNFPGGRDPATVEAIMQRAVRDHLRRSASRRKFLTDGAA